MNPRCLVADVIVHEHDRAPSIDPLKVEIDPPLEMDPVFSGHGGTLRLVNVSQKNISTMVAVTFTAIETTVPAANVLEQSVMKLVHVLMTLPPALNLIVPVTSLSCIAPVGVTVSVYFGTVVVVVAATVVVVAATVVVVAATVVVVAATVVVVAASGPLVM